MGILWYIVWTSFLYGLLILLWMCRHTILDKLSVAAKQFV